MNSNLSTNDVVNYLYNNLILYSTDSEFEYYDYIQEITNKYEYLIEVEQRKKTGSFYTDDTIIKYMVENVLTDINIVENPFVKILDPACGCGYFLLKIYDNLKDIIEVKIHEINKRYPGLNLNQYNIHEHIIKHNIFGSDNDECAVKLTRIGLMMKQKGSRVIPDNVKCCDSIMDWENTIFDESRFWTQGFDIIVGNPPYIGHKKVSGSYRNILNTIYGDIFKDKADISFCFIKSSIDRLVEGGRLCFITSRYFVESPSGKALREYIKNNCMIEKIIDFYGVRIMKGISVDPIVIFIRKKLPCGNSMIEVHKAKSELKRLENNKVFTEITGKSNRYYTAFKTQQSQLNNDGWILCSEIEKSIVQKIESLLKLKLSDICMSFQGIYKFRTMVKNADDMLKLNIDSNNLGSLVFQDKNDARITRLGGFLRRTSLDELPQLLNVFIGNMSLVGPRPEIPAVADFYNDIQKLRLCMRPGITGLAQVSGRGEIELDRTIGYDLEYIKNFSIWLDIKILFRTVTVVFKKEGAF